MRLIDPLSFGVGFIVGILFTWLLGRMRPLLQQMRENLKEQREAAQVRRTSGLEANHRRLTLRRAQGMHLAASLFSLDDILQEPCLIAPPARVEPGVVGIQEDIISQTLPYMPAWPELSAIYRASTLSVTEALEGGSNIVIVGAAGTGKTVALAHLASLAANLKVRLDAKSEAESVPYLYHVADLRLPFDAAKDPINVLVDAVSERAPMFDLGRMPGFVQQTCKDGQALLLLDGFDELDPKGHAEVVDWLKALLSTYPKVRIVTTGCFSQLDGLVSIGFSPLALCAWDAQRDTEFIQQWGELWTRTVALETTQPGREHVDPVLLNTWLLSDNTGLSPFELTLKVWGAYAGDSLGPRVLDAIATHVRRLAPTGTPLAALELLAMQVVLTSQPVFDPKQARAWVKQYDVVDDHVIEGAETLTKTADGTDAPVTDSQKIRIKKSKASNAVPSFGLLSKMVDSGLLVSHPNEKMRFLHPVLSGYLSSQAIGENNSDATLLAQPEWDGKTLSLRYLAARGDASAIADILLNQSEIPLHTQTFIVARWLRDAPKDAAWRKKVFAALLTILQAEGQPLALRGQAMAAFVTSGDAGAATLFRQLLGSRSFELLPIAALGSGALRDVKAVEMLEDIMQAPSGAVRRASCLALVSIGTEKSMEAVARALLQGDEDLRRAAAESLANDPGEGHAMLKEGATLADDIMVRRAVVHGLSRIHQPWSISLLEKMQLDDDQWAVRNLATQYLEQLQHVDPRVPRRLKAPSEAPWLIEFAGKQGMGIPRGGPATDVLVSAFKVGDTEQRLAALPYLKRVGNEGIIGALYNGIYGEDPEVREAAFYALEEIAANGTKIPHPNQFGLG